MLTLRCSKQEVEAAHYHGPHRILLSVLEDWTRNILLSVNLFGIDSINSFLENPKTTLREYKNFFAKFRK